jgi:NADH-quinone oxidoreductase subunit E
VNESVTRTAFDADTLARLEVDAKEIIGRYPKARSALLPMLHLVQSEEGYVSPHGIEFCAAQLDLTAAEVAAVATFYTQYKRRPNGEYTVGVCTNTLCAIMGGDQVFATLKDHLGIGHDETTEDGVVTLEHLECNAACDYAPVMMVNWEFFDNQTPESAVDVVDALRSGHLPLPTRGASLCTFKQVSRVLAGFPDGRAGEGPVAGPATLAGLDIYREQQNAGKRRKAEDESAGAPAPRKRAAKKAATSKTLKTPAVTDESSAHDAPQDTAESDDANVTPPANADQKDGEA